MPVDKQISEKVLGTLLQHKKEVLDNITTQYKEEMADANADGERLFKYGFIFAGAIQTVMGGLAAAFQHTPDILVFSAALLFLTLAVSAVLYERVRIEKAALRQHANAQREPILEQISILKGFLEADEE
jgi:hypothetical protein